MKSFWLFRRQLSGLCPGCCPETVCSWPGCLLRWERVAHSKAGAAWHHWPLREPGVTRILSMVSEVSCCHLSWHQGSALGEGRRPRGQHLVEVPLPGHEGVGGPGDGRGGRVAGAGCDRVCEAPEQSVVGSSVTSVHTWDDQSGRRETQAQRWTSQHFLQVLEWW